MGTKVRGDNDPTRKLNNGSDGSGGMARKAEAGERTHVNRYGVDRALQTPGFPPWNRAGNDRGSTGK